LTPELEAKAREVLRSQVEANAKPEKVEPLSSSDAQAKALAVLRQQEATTTSTPPPQSIPQPPPASKAAPKPVAQPTTVAPPKTVTVPKTTPAPRAQPTPQPAAKAPVLAAQPEPKPKPKTKPEAELAAKPQPQPTAAAQPKPTPRPVAAAPAPKPVPAAAPVESTPNPEAQAKAFAALRQYEQREKSGLQADTPELTKALRVKVAELEGTAVPVAEPVPPPSSDKAGLERLAELTAQYKADRMTPEQYHQERAKIISTLH
jgi:hypothetical protein